MLLVASCSGGDGGSGPTGPIDTTTDLLVHISRRYPSLFSGDTTALSATTTDLAGALVSRAIAWSTSNAAIATVSSAGVVSGVAAGTAWVTAAAENSKDSVAVVVLPTPMSRVNRGFGYILNGGSVWAMPGDSSTAVQLVPAELNGQDFRWSPDGSLLALLHTVSTTDITQHLYVMRADGSGEVMVSGYDIRPRWSPDSRRLAFRTHDGNIGVINADGTDRHLLTTGGGDELNPEWSPDGRRIGFREGDCAGLSLMNADGTERHHVPLPSTMCNLVWSPDGKLIAYESRSDATSPGAGVWLMNSDGSDPRPISGNCTESGVCSGTSWWHPVWSPDAKVLAINGLPGSTVVKLYSVVTGQTTEITMGGARFEVVGWSPDMTRLGIAVEGQYGDPQGIGTSQPDGSDFESLLARPMDLSTLPQWRP
jgi:Tol biopolymer transport system component